MPPRGAQSTALTSPASAAASKRWAKEAILAADALAAHRRALVDAIVETTARGDRLGQLVRNFFECLGLAEEGAQLALRCGERPDSPLR